MTRACILWCLVGLLGLLAPSAWADDAAQELTPTRRAELEKESLRLNQEGMQLYRAGRFAEAVQRMQEALAMTQKLYPAARYPAGHPHLAGSLNNLGGVLQAMGASERALPYC